jgi:N-acyl-D-amino-acid deacylase
MARPIFHALLLVIIRAALPAADGEVAPAAVDPEVLREAAARGLRIVEKAARSYPDHRSCFSCHHQTLPLLAMATGRVKGLRVDGELFDAQAEFTHASFAGRGERIRTGEGVGGASLTVGYGLWALAIAGWKRDSTTRAMVEYLLEKQDADGSWKRTSSRPPLEDSNFTCTILAVHYLRRFAEPDLEERVEAAAARARDWVLASAPATHEDRVSRLGALPLLGADAAEIEKARRVVLDAQREDGGWAQLDGMESDAYATGLTLFTLQRIGFPAGVPAFRRGLDFLLATQCADGSWHVRTRSRPIQTFFDNGDPHGADQFISVPATAWATTALALALPAPRRMRL